MLSSTKPKIHYFPGTSDSFPPSLLLFGMESNSKMVSTDFIHTCSPWKDFHSSPDAFPIFSAERKSRNYGSGIEEPHATLHTVNMIDQFNEIPYNHQHLDGWFSFLNLAIFILNFYLSAFSLLLKKKCRTFRLTEKFA